MARNQTRKERKQYDAPSTKADDLKDKRIEFVECRAYRFHAWRLVGHYRWRDEQAAGVCRVSECMRCTMEREDFYLPDGALYYRAYNLPDGYALEGTGVVTMYDAQRELMRRSTIASSREAMTPASAPLRLVRSS